MYILLWIFIVIIICASDKTDTYGDTKYDRLFRVTSLVKKPDLCYRWFRPSVMTQRPSCILRTVGKKKFVSTITLIYVQCSKRCWFHDALAFLLWFPEILVQVGFSESKAFKCYFWYYLTAILSSRIKKLALLN